MDDRPRMLPYPDPPLADGVVRLRPWERRDLPCLESAATDPRITRRMGVPAVYSREDGVAYIDRQLRRLRDGEGLPLAIESTATESAVGFIVMVFRREPAVVGLGYWVVPPERGRGFASRAVSLLAPWALRLGSVGRVEALVEPDNSPSLRTVDRSGFRREGLLRSFFDGERDAWMYSLICADLSGAERVDFHA